MKEGTQLGPYRVGRLLGKGAMGEVYLAHDENLGRDIAIKVLPPEFADDERRLARLRREARALAALNQANVAILHGFEEYDGTSVIVMELVEGRTLADRLLQGPLPLREALQLAAQIARGIEAAHEKGIVHRDLKPGNVMVTQRGEAKVLDFGLAKLVLSETELADAELPTATLEATRAGEVMGTAPYMSPEQARGRQVDERTDVWAFGCLLYEMLSGRRAFDRETIADTLAAILEAEPNWDALPGDTPEALRSLMRRMLTKEADRRLGDIGEARIQLEEMLAPGAPTMEATLPGRPSGLKLAVTMAGIVVLAVVLALGWSEFAGDRVVEVTDRSIAVLPFETLGQEVATAFTDGIHGDMLTRLSKISGLSVISRTSVMRFRKAEAPLREIARELGVSWVLLGEVQEAGNQVQVNARLVYAPEDRQVWAETYRRDLTAESVFEIQSEIAEKIAAQLQAQLTPEELLAVERVPTESLEAYRLYFRGRAYLEQRTEDDMRRALDYFEHAIDQDPDYALAWAGLADALSLLNWYGYEIPPDTPGPERAALRALELGPELAEAHASLGIYLSSTARPDAVAALRELQTAVALRPSYAEAYVWVAWVNLLLGRPEAALEPAERAAKLDPLSPVIRVFLAETYLANGAWETARDEARRAREIQTEYALAHFMEGVALYHLGDFEAASATLSAALALVPPDGQSPTRSQVRVVMAIIEAATGDESGLRALLEEIEALAEPFPVGLVYAALGDVDAAFEAFSRVDLSSSLAVEQLRYFFPQVLGPLREDARYQELIQGIDRSLGGV